MDREFLAKKERDKAEGVTVGRWLEAAIQEKLGGVIAIVLKQSLLQMAIELDISPHTFPKW